MATCFRYDERIGSKKNSSEFSNAGHDKERHQQLGENFKPILVDAPRLVADFARFFNWPFDVILSTPAPTFFALLKSAKDIKREESVLHLIDQCDIAAISWGAKKYYDELRKNFSDRLLSEDKLKARDNPKVFDVSVKERADAAADLFKKILKPR